MIGVFDSGLGGLTALREAQRLMPDHDFVYFGDTGRVPYGTRSAETITRYTAQCLRFLDGKRVDAVLAACGTVSSVALDRLQRDYFFPIVGVVKPAAAAAAAATRNGRIGVIGTGATIASRSFEKRLKALDGTIETMSVACPLLVPLVENGFIAPDDDVALPAVRRYLAPLREFGIDTLILGCTHFPLLADVIRTVLPAVTLINSGQEAARALADTVPRGGESGHTTFYVSDNPDNFSAVASLFLGESFKGGVIKIDVDSL